MLSSYLSLPWIGIQVCGATPNSFSSGQTDLQVSQQFQEGTRIWEATNSSLQQQLREKISQLGQKEVELQESQKELISSQDTLQEKQRTHKDTEQQLQACQAERAKTKENLKTEEERRRDLDQRLTSTRETLRRLSSCSSGICSGIGRWGWWPMGDGLGVSKWLGLSSSHKSVSCFWAM